MAFSLKCISAPSWQLQLLAKTSRWSLGRITTFPAIDEGDGSHPKTILLPSWLLLAYMLKIRAATQSTFFFILNLLSFIVLLGIQVGISQTVLPHPRVRVTAAIDDQNIVTLERNMSRPEPLHDDKGSIALSTPTGTMRLLLRRDQGQERELQRFLDNVQNPHSPQYHRWLNPQEYGIHFGVADEDLSAVKSWLQRKGFTIEGVPSSKTFVEFSGTIDQVEQAFHTSIHSYSFNHVQYVKNTTGPKIPLALAPVIAGLSPLNNFRAKAQQSVNKPLQVSATPNNNLQSLLQVASSTTPLLVGQSSVYITAADAATIYNSPNAWNRNFSGGTQWTGAGINIGIAAYSDLPTTDYLNYRKLFLNEAVPVMPTLIVDGTDPGILDQHDGQVTLIDAEIAAGLAPQANIYVYSSQSDLLEDGLINAVIRAVEDNVVAILSVSYTKCEASLGASGNLQWNELWKQASAQGISVVVAAGDTGTAGCDGGGPVATGGLAVSGIASTPYNVAVGGTDFDVLGSSFSTYIDSTTSESTLPYQSFVTGYIPENPWNDSISNTPPGVSSTNVIAEYDFGEDTTSIVAATGGGASSMAYCIAGIDPSTGDCLGPLAGYPAPPFQSGVSAGATVPSGVRFVPDVALFAGTNTQYPATWAVCSDNLVAQANYTFTDCNPTQDGTYSVEGAGGTGTSTAAFAGVLGMVLQSLGPNTRLGVANNVLYNLYASGSRASIFHDVIAGNNSVPCAANSLNCDSNSFLTGYDAGPGYDLASGLGSIDVSALIAAWPTVVFTATNTTLSVDGTVAPLILQHGNAVTLAASVTPSAATGVVSVSGFANQAGAAVEENIPLLNGVGSISTNKLPGGTYTIQGYYPGDVNNSPSTSSPLIQITVTPEDSALQLSTQVVDVNSTQIYSNSFPYGAYGFVYVKPVSANPNSGGSSGPATGVVTLLNHGIPLSQPNSPSQQVVNSVGRAAFPLAAFTPGSYSLGAMYEGDRSYNASSTISETGITIQKGSTRLTANPSSSIMDISASTTVTITLDTDSAGQFPTGAITLTANSISFPGTIQQVLTPLNAVEEIATFQVAGSVLAPGVNKLIAMYGGDGNYNGSSTTATITITGGSTTAPGSSPDGTFSLTGPLDGITVPALTASATGIVNVSALNGFTGTVNLSCTLTGATGTGANAPRCSVTPAVTLQSQTPATATVTINTATMIANHLPQSQRGEHNVFRIRAAGEESFALCSILILLVPANRRTLRSLSITFLALGTLGVLGCSVHRNQIASPAANYTAVVTGTSGSTVVSTQISVTIQ